MPEQAALAALIEALEAWSGWYTKQRSAIPWRVEDDLHDRYIIYRAATATPAVSLNGEREIGL